MAIALIDFTNGAATVDATTGGISSLGGTFAVFGRAWYPGSAPTFALSDDQGNASFTQYTTQAGSFAAAAVLRCLTTPLLTGASHHWTSDSLGDIAVYQVLTAQVFSGVDLVTAPQENGALDETNTLSSFQGGSITPAVDGCLCLSVCCAGNSSVTGLDCNIGTKNIVQASAGVYVGGGVAWVIQTTATAFNPTWSWGTFTSTVAVANIAFRPAAAGDPPAMGGRAYRQITRPAAFRPGLGR